MHYLLLICSLYCSSLIAQSTLYTTADFALYLQADSSFVFYPKEMSLKARVAGDYTLRNDSLILTTHQVDGIRAIFAIYSMDELRLDLLHSQKEFLASLPTRFYKSKTFYPDRSLHQEYRWLNEKQGNYDLYTFSDDLYMLSLEKYEHHQLDGLQLYYFNNPYAVIEKQVHYKAGLLEGASFYFEALNKDYLQVQLVKEAHYKKGILKRTKTPATPPIFYTSHF